MKTTRTIILPAKLKSEIDKLELTGIQRQHAYRLCETMINQQSRDGHDHNGYVELPQEYMRKIFGGGNYHRFLDKLKPCIIEIEGWTNEEGVFIESYSNGDGGGQSKRYRIRPDLLGFDFVPAISRPKHLGPMTGK